MAKIDREKPELQGVVVGERWDGNPILHGSILQDCEERTPLEHRSESGFVLWLFFFSGIIIRFCTCTVLLAP